MASWWASGVADGAVCEAARWPAGDRAPITVSTGIRCATRRAVPANLRGLPNDSTYSTASWVTSSCAHQVSRSVGDTSYLSPADTKDDTPIPSRDICSSSAIPTPPDCTTRPTTPRTGWPAVKVASRPIHGMITPKQLGPSSRMPCRRQAAFSSAPAAPRQELSTIRARTPWRPHCSATPGTAAGGTAITARSTGPGRSSTDATHGTPSRVWACGLTAQTGPVKPPVTRLCRMARPMLARRRPGPTTATDRGCSSGRRLATSARLSRLATASR